MPTYYKVAQGDYLSKIAFKYGFSDAQTIWSDPHNGQLQKKRKSPQILLPGDLVYIPDRTAKQSSAVTAKTHHYTTRKSLTILRVALKDWDGEPLVNCSCLLKIEDRDYQLATDDAGMLEAEIPTAAAVGRLVVDDYNEEIQLKIGCLDPSSEETGWKGRLCNLGYCTGEEEEDPDALEAAVEEFQCNAGLDVNGVCGPETIAQLENAHGC